MLLYCSVCVSMDEGDDATTALDSFGQSLMKGCVMSSLLISLVVKIVNR